MEKINNLRKLKSINHINCGKKNNGTIIEKKLSVQAIKHEQEKHEDSDDINISKITSKINISESSTCLPVQISLTDHLSKAVCKDSVYKLDQICEVRQKCIETDKLSQAMMIKFENNVHVNDVHVNDDDNDKKVDTKNKTTLHTLQVINNLKIGSCDQILDDKNDNYDDESSGDGKLFIDESYNRTPDVSPRRVLESLANDKNNNKIDDDEYDLNYYHSILDGKNPRKRKNKPIENKITKKTKLDFIDTKVSKVNNLKNTEIDKLPTNNIMDTINDFHRIPLEITGENIEVQQVSLKVKKQIIDNNDQITIEQPKHIQVVAEVHAIPVAQNENMVQKPTTPVQAFRKTNVFQGKSSSQKISDDVIEQIISQVDDKSNNLNNLKIPTKTTPPYIGDQCCQTLKKHTNTNNEKSLRCPVCEKAFTKKHAFDYHVLTHSGQKQSIKSTHTKKQMNTIIGKKLFSCLICEKAFSRKQALDYHQLTNKGQCEKKHRCQTCGLFVNECYFESHAQGHEASNDKLIKCLCEICGRFFSTIYNLQLHLTCTMETKKSHCE